MLEDQSEGCRRLEDLWRIKLRAAHDRYREAAVQSLSVTEEQQRGLLIGADGFHAVRKALREESAALREHKRVLKIFTDFVIHGKLPPEE